jgi:hypothetical protein
MAFVACFLVVADFTMFNTLGTSWVFSVSHETSWKTFVTFGAVTACPAIGVAFGTLETMFTRVGKVRFSRSFVHAWIAVRFLEISSVAFGARIWSAASLTSGWALLTPVVRA